MDCTRYSGSKLGKTQSRVTVGDVFRLIPITVSADADADADA
jgi:hypothetical protein